MDCRAGRNSGLEGDELGGVEMKAMRTTKESRCRGRRVGGQKRGGGAAFLGVREEVREVEDKGRYRWRQVSGAADPASENMGPRFATSQAEGLGRQSSRVQRSCSRVGWPNSM